MPHAVNNPVFFGLPNLKNVRNSKGSGWIQLSMAISPSLDTRFPALILKASRDFIHHGALGVARTLGRLDVPVYAVVEDAYTPLATSRYLTKAFVWKSWPS